MEYLWTYFNNNHLLPDRPNLLNLSSLIYPQILVNYLSLFSVYSDLRFCLQQFLWPSLERKVRVEKRYKCIFCDKSFFCRREKIYHIRTKHFDLFRKQDKSTGDLHRIFQGVRTYECYRCQISKTDLNSLNKHMKGCVLKTVKCELCDRRVKSIHSLKEHLRQSHSINEQRLNKEQMLIDGKKMFQCIDCESYLVYRDTYNRHVRFHCSKRRFKCGFCSQKFLRESDKIDHHHHVHPTLLETSHSQKFKCHICMVCMPLQTALKHLAEQHQWKTQFKLNICRLILPELSEAAQMHRNMK